MHKIETKGEKRKSEFSTDTIMIPKAIIKRQNILIYGLQFRS